MTSLALWARLTANAPLEILYGWMPTCLMGAGRLRHHHHREISSFRGVGLLACSGHPTGNDNHHQDRIAALVMMLCSRKLGTAPSSSCTFAPVWIFGPKMN